MTTKKLIKGNEALGEGAIQAGCDTYFGYPITPQNELTEYMSRRMLEEKRIFIQSESELAAINMVFGSSAAGARAMTSSSSPGISLKQEGLSYMAGCELPGLVVNVQRGGPGLGNISGSQGDYFQAVKGGGHGDYHLLVFTPGSVQEMYEMPALAFSLSEKYRTPAMILTDGILAQMQEPMEQVKIDASRIGDRNWILDGCKGRQPRKIRSLLMEEGALEAHNQHLQKKYEEIKKKEQRYQLINEQAEIMLVAFGISARICYTALEEANQKGFKVGLLRPQMVWPFPEKILQELASKVKAFLVIELNAGQMVEDVKLAVNGKTPVHFYGRAGGGCVTPEEVIKEIEKI
ncbi:MAG: 3-methyl-2-oxobutanoate dehydrogenase subunit VorB [bacterium]|nr:3-methyl-2-oxobutanoate dehydrogenase subunit VorB [bacterium]MDD5756743.1 3-methyl-2-oxobutanoate dehydrogenase subunit VorB [bacterium]